MTHISNSNPRAGRDVGRALRLPAGRQGGNLFLPAYYLGMGVIQRVSNDMHSCPVSSETIAFVRHGDIYLPSAETFSIYFETPHWLGCDSQREICFFLAFLPRRFYLTRSFEGCERKTCNGEARFLISRTLLSYTSKDNRAPKPLPQAIMGRSLQQS
jgi:hypothetical protein